MADRWPWVKAALLIAITACAALFRLHRIDSLPPADGYDAAYYGVDALHILRGQPPQLMYPPNREPLFSYLVAGSFLLFGASTTAIHLTSALVGILTVPLVCWAADAVFKEAEGPLHQWGGLLAALMTALSYWHLNWSRIGVRAILVPLVAASTITFLWRGRPPGGGSGHADGLDRERLGDLVMCGISLGLSMYTYQAARLIPALVIVSFVASAWKRGTVAKRETAQVPTITTARPHLAHSSWQQLMIVIAVALLVFAPLGIHFVTHPGSFSQRIEEALVVQPDQAVVNNLRTVVKQAWETLLAFSFVGDRTPYSTIPGRPSLNPFFSALLFLGIVFSLLDVRKPSRVLLLFWLCLMTIPAILAGKGPTAKRAIGTLPAVAMLIAIGGLTPYLWVPSPTCWASRHRRRWKRLKALLRLRRPTWITTAWTLILVGGFAYSGFVTYRDYFIVWASNPNLPTHFEAHLSSIGEYIGGLPPEQQVYVSPELPRHPSIRFHANLREDVRGYNGRVCFVAPSQTLVETTYIIVPGKDDTSLDLLKAYFPEGKRASHSSAAGQTAFASYQVSAGAHAGVQPAHPLKARWRDDVQFLGYDLDKEVYRPGETISLKLTYRDLRRMEKRYTAFVHLIGPVNPATGHPLWGQNDSEPCHGFYPTTSWHEGEIVINRIELRIHDDAPTGTYRLGTGFYDVWTGERLPLEGFDKLTGGSEAASIENDTLFLREVDIDAGE